MSTTANQPDDRFPTTGPSDEQYESYSFEWTSDGEGLIYDDQNSDEWIQAGVTISLDAWR